MLDINRQPYVETGLNSTFSGAGLEFDAYCDASQAMIAKATGDPEQAQLCAARQAGAAETDQLGVILIHGLLDSPYCMSSLFDHFRAQPLCVRSVLLPGHGTVPGDLLSVRCEAWQQATAHAIDSLRGKVKKLIVVGYSTGATLALQYASTHGGIDGLVLFAPALKVRTRLIGITRWHDQLGRWWPRWRWLQLLREDDRGRYSSVTMNSAYQVHRLSQQFKSLAEKSAPPLMLITTDDDSVICNQTCYRFFEQQTHPRNRAIHYTADPKPTRDPRIEHRYSRYDELKIVDFSHVCLAIAPNHPQWGQASQFKDFAHYQDKHGHVTKRPQHKPHALGSVSRHNRRHYDLQRLHYNPDFANLMRDVDGFIMKIGD